MSELLPPNPEWASDESKPAITRAIAEWIVSSLHGYHFVDEAEQRFIDSFHCFRDSNWTHDNTEPRTWLWAIWFKQPEFALTGVVLHMEYEGAMVTNNEYQDGYRCVMFDRHVGRGKYPEDAFAMAVYAYVQANKAKMQESPPNE